MQEREIALHRRWIRMNALGTVDAQLRIKALGSRQVQTNERKVLLTELSPVSLRFQTTLWLPPQESWTVALSFALADIPVEAVGLITQASEEDRWWKYEVELRNDPVARTLLTRLLNQRLKSSSPILYRIHDLYRHSNW